MAETPQAPEWCVPGATLMSTASRDDRGGYRQRVPMLAVTVVKLTATQVVVANENGHEVRFRLDGESRPYKKGVGSFDETRYLAPVDAPDVQAALRARRIARLAGEVEKLAMRWRRDQDAEAARGIAAKLVEGGVIASYTAAEET